MLANRLKKNKKRLKNYLKKNSTQAYRLYERDMPEYPYNIDIYNEHAVIYERGKKEVDETTRQQTQQEIRQALEEIGIPNHHFKIRQVQKGKDQYERSKYNPNPLKIVVEELGANFEIDLETYLDTGLFLDHRPLRKIIKEEAKGKSLLNLFCYTSSISVHAALGGAHTTNVDLSNTYLEWSMRNFKLNGLNPGEHKFLKADILQFLDVDQDQKYDIIVLDPPSFSNSKSMEKTLDIQRDHCFLIESCMKLLKSNGILYFSNNKRDFKIDKKLEDMFSVKDISQETIPEDYRDKKIHQAYKIQHT
jgi:23S rRNA (cytosine1962-C5)-methyltransferase